MGDTAQNLTDRARRACEMVGSALVRNLSYGESWAIVGQRGSAPGTAVEEMSASARVTTAAEWTTKS